MNSGRVFLTGGSGFVGRTLLRALQNIDGLHIVALDRSGSLAGGERVTMVRGNLLAPETYREALRGCDCVLHLAAATGKASAETHFRETAVGTEVLVKTCHEAGVTRLLLVSSIAAAFPDKRGYPYAVAKERAERAVAESGLRFCILRPTMIFGEAAPVLASLSKLALLPFVVVPGSGKVRVQPISVDDVARSILVLLRTDRFRNETFELGGPEVLSIETLLQRVRMARIGIPGRALRVPLPLIQAPLIVAERIGLRAVLPTTAGQLTSFKHEGIAAPNVLQEELQPDMARLDRMLNGRAPTTATPDPIERECHTFTRHLLGVSPDRAVVDHYRAALATLPTLSAESRWDRAFLSFAGSGGVRLRCADVFAAFFDRGSVLRKRLVILLAILETRAPFSDHIDRPLGSSVPVAVARVALRGVWSLLLLIAATLILLPMRIAFQRGESAR